MEQFDAVGHVGRHRHQVFGERGRDGRGVGVVDEAFEQRVAEAVRDTADDLAVHDQRIDDASAVVADDEAGDLDMAGLDVDLDLGDVAARGVGGLVGLEVDGRFEAGIAVGGHREAVHADGEIGDLAERLLHAGRALHVDRAILQFEVGLRDLHHFRGDLFDLGCDFDGGEMGRVAGIDGRARGERAHAQRDPAGVASDDRNVLERHAELIGDDLRERGFVALSVRRGASCQRDLAGRGNAHGRAFVGAEAGAFDRVRYGHADVTALGECRLLARREPFPVDGFEGGALALGIIAAVVGDGPAVAEHDADLVGHLLRLDEIAAADFGAVDAELLRDEVHHAFHREHGLGAARAAHGRARGLVGVHDSEIEIVGRQHVGAGHGRRCNPRQHEAPRDVGPVVMHEAALEAEQLAVVVDGYREIPPLVALLMGDVEIFAAVLDPFHRTTEGLRGRCHCTVLAIERALGAEAAADFRRDDADLIVAEFQHVHERALQAVRALAGDVCGERARHLVEARDEAARLDEERAAAMLEDAILEDVRGLGEGRVDVAVLHRHPRDDVVGGADVRGQLGVVEGIADIGDGLQHVPVYLDETSRILCNIAAVGEHHGDGLADDAGLVLGQHVLHADLLDRGIGHVERQALLTHHVGQVFPRPDRVHAGEGLGFRGVDGNDAGVGVRRASERCMERAGGIEVVDELALAGEQGRILFALHRLPEPAAALRLACLVRHRPVPIPDFSSLRGLSGLLALMQHPAGHSRFAL